MATLQGTKIKDTYGGILKTNDNLVLGQQTASVITDGAGNATPLSLAQEKVILAKDNQIVEVNDVQTTIKGNIVFIADATSTNLVQATSTSIGIGNNTNNLAFDATNAAFAGAVDFAGATVTGIDTGVQSVVAGTNVTVDNTDPANPIVSAAGGGGGGSSAAYHKSGLSPAMSNFSWNTSTVWNSPWMTTGYSGSNFSVPSDKSVYIPVIMKSGVTMGSFQFDVGVAGGTTDIGFYKSYEFTDTDSTKWLMPEYVATIASGVDVSTTGTKTITGVNIAIPTDGVDGVYWIAFSSNSTTYSLRRWSNIIWPWNFSQSIYRTLGMFDNSPSLFTGGQMTSFTGAGTTDSSIQMGWKYI